MEVILKCKRDPYITAREIRAELGREDVCLKTITSAIHKHGELNSYWQTMKPYISKKNQKARIEWCKDHRHWSSADWRSVIWSDESPYVLRYNCRKRLWRRHNERYAIHALRGNFKNDVKIMVWGCFSATGVGHLHLIEGIMDSKAYMKILDNELRPSAKALFGKKPWILQQDNDRKHTAQATKDYLEDHNISCMVWPAQSPDLNPLENLWSILDNKCSDRACKNANSLFEVLLKAWKLLDRELLEKLVDSMPERIEAVIAAKGLPTHY
jgi:hypothetical protein